MASILVVEDDPVSQKILQNLLGKRGHQVFAASGVGEALTQLHKQAIIDLVVLDNQLQGEYGWEFLQQVRRDFVFKNIPVLVYSASSDRNSVLKYLQLGVQKILVKPYNTKHLEEEIGRAVQFEWRSMIFEPVDRVAQRLMVSEDDYYQSLSKAATDILETVPRLNQLIGRKNSREFDDHISNLHSCALNLGISILENATEAIQNALAKDRLDQGVYYINRLIPTARLMQHRALAHFGIANLEDEDESRRAALLKRHQDPSRMPPPQPRATPESNDINLREALDEMLQNPLNAFGEDFSRLLDRQIFTAEETIAAFNQQPQRLAIAAYLQSSRELCELDKIKTRQLRETIQQIPGLNGRMVNLANVADSGVRDLDKAIEKMGIAYAASISATLTWLKAAKQDRNPLKLEPLAQHSLAVAFLSRELSMKFKDPHSFTSAGLLHNAGKWLVALQFPAFFGIALTVAKNEPARLQTAFQSLFGVNDTALGLRLLVPTGIPRPYTEVIAFHNKPEKAAAGSARTLAAIVNLANHLAKIHGIGYSGTKAEGGEEAFIQSSAWDALKTENVDIPLTPKDYLSALRLVAEKVKRQIQALFD